MYGYSIHSGDREFQVPDTYNRTDKYRIDADGIKYIRVNGVRWFTNMRLQDSNDKLILFKKYIPEEYPKLDNYDAINVDKMCDIPADYEGVIAVPVSFFDKYNPDQFEIIGKIEPVCLKKYIPEEYPKLDNYDAINVDKTCDIPADYYGVIAVPVSFFDKYNPDQFEIIGKIEPVCRGKRIYKRLLIKKKS